MKLQFEWDENKRLSNLNKHNIDFEDATLIFEHSVPHAPSGFRGEERWITLGELNGVNDHGGLDLERPEDKDHFGPEIERR